MVVGGRQDTVLNLASLLVGNHHQNLPTISTELILLNESQLMSPSFTVCVVQVATEFFIGLKYLQLTEYLVITDVIFV